MADKAYQAVFFDLDGVLLNSEHPALAAFLALMQEHGIERTLDDLRVVCGRPKAYLHSFLDEQLCGSSVSTAAFIEQYTARKDALLQSGKIQPFPEAVTVLTNLKQRGWKLALATSTERQLVERRLAGTGILDAFDASVTGDEIVNGKPAPDIFLRAADKLNVPPEHCVVVEDSLAGVEAGRRAGMRVIAIAGTFQREHLSEAHLVLSSLSELEEALTSAEPEILAVS